jgi:hypothetical protein
VYWGNFTGIGAPGRLADHPRECRRSGGGSHRTGWKDANRRRPAMPPVIMKAWKFRVDAHIREGEAQQAVRKFDH